MEIGDGGDSWRRRPKESSHLRDFIQLKQAEEGAEEEEEEEVARRNSLTGLTLSDVLGEPRRPTPTPTLPVQSNRTLLDIIREEDPNSSSYYKQKNKTSWKAFTEKLRLSRTITATVHVSNPNRQSQSIGIPSLNNAAPDPGRESLSDLLLRSGETNGELNSVQSNQQQAVITLVNSSGEDAAQEEVGMSLTALLGGENGEREPDVGISLMALLAETDREIGSEGLSIASEEEEEEEAMEKEIGGRGEGGVDLMKRCCICMVRQKGAAFIPCGHAFCRICCRELWVQRGNCPLCNALILEILDIF